MSKTRLKYPQIFSKGFTLAEVLITLGIIGVVAAMTIPTLMNNIQDAQFKTAYKKSYSVLSQALAQANSDYALETSSVVYDTAHLRNFKVLMSYIKTQKTCYSLIVDNSDCWYRPGEGYNSSSYQNGFPTSTNDYIVVDASGMDWSTYSGGYDHSILVDTNGFQKPNQMGKDRFRFMLYDETGSSYSGLPTKISPLPDNQTYACKYNRCGTAGNPDYNTYYATSWLYGAN